VLWNIGLSALGKCGKTLGKCWEDAGNLGQCGQIAGKLRERCCNMIDKMLENDRTCWTIVGRMLENARINNEINEDII
jgi:hypothetical protein